MSDKKLVERSIREAAELESSVEGALDAVTRSSVGGGLGAEFRSVETKGSLKPHR